MTTEIVLSESTSNLTVGSLRWFLENINSAEKYRETNPKYADSCLNMARVWLGWIGYFSPNHD